MHEFRDKMRGAVPPAAPTADNRKAVGELPALVLFLDHNWRIAKADGNWGAPDADDFEAIVGRCLSDLIPEVERHSVMELLERQLQVSGWIGSVRVPIIDPSGVSREFYLSALSQMSSGGNLVGAVAILTEAEHYSGEDQRRAGRIGELESHLAELLDNRQRVEQQGREIAQIAENLAVAKDEAERAYHKAEESERRFRTIVGSVADAILVIDRAGVIQLFSHSAETVFGVSVVDYIGKNIASLIRSEDDSFQQYLASELPKTARYRREMLGIYADGSEFPMELTATETKFDDSTAFVIICRDISDRKQAENKLEMLAKFDPLTGLANRFLFQEKLEEALRTGERSQRGIAILYLDLDHFKDINDTLGHITGDNLLKVVAQRLQYCVRDTDTVARLGGDEFAIIAPNLLDRQTIHHLADRIIAAMNDPIEIDSNTVHTGTSIGITLYPDDDIDPERLLKNADLALYRAKSNGRNVFEFFRSEMNDAVHARIQMENELRGALESTGLSLHYQPQVEMSTGRIVGVEALIRWRNQHGDMVPPGAFIPVAESSGLMENITEWVLRNAVRQLRSWRDKDIFSGHVAVNLSASDLKRPMLHRIVEEILHSTGMEPSFLELEITEDVMMESVDSVVGNLRRFRDMGIRLAIDDFGTGYSSLAYLRRFSVDRLKVDQTFVADLSSNPDDVVIIEAVINMARSLGLRVVAEGVETEEQFLILERMGCDEVQGYYIGRPQPPTAFEELMREIGHIAPSRDLGIRDLDRRLVVRRRSG